MTDPTVETLDWQRIEDIFHRLSELPVEQQRPAAERECSGQPEMLAEVLALLEASADPSNRVDGAIRGTLEAWLENDEKPSVDGVPEQLGPFRILRRLSEGGQAVVYLAERRQPYRQQVAIKLLKRGMDTDEILRRLNLERQILAQLEHPNIARLLDGGSSPDGRPYFALEYIDGEPIDRFCDLGRLDVPSRLRLFRRACAAVHVAHSRLVIHRDLKPSNLLVTHDGEPKLLDFGIAKLLDTSPLDATAAWTRTGVRWLTPNFAAPEQVLGKPLTTAVDIYALGVLLYVLLTGDLPRKFNGQQPSEIERTFGKRLEPPSARVARQASQEVADRRATTVDRLVRRLQGDLDTIVTKALHPEADRRYGSVQQMAEDIDRHLRSEPVLARGDTWSYRWSKFVRRNRAGVGAVALVFGSLVAGVIGTTRAMRVADTQRMLADSQRLLAEQRLDEVEAVMGFTTNMFKIADPGEGRGSEVTVREILDQQAARVDDELADQPAIAARLMTTMGEVYRNLGLYPSASKLLRSAGERWRTVEKGHENEVLDNQRRMAAVLFDEGRFQEAHQLLITLAQDQNRLLPNHHRAHADVLHLTGLVTWQLEDPEAAEPILLQALEDRLTLLGDEDLAVAESRNDLGQVLSSLGRLEEAEKQYRQALDLRQRKLRDTHPLTVETHHNLATVLEKRNLYSEAETELRRVLELRRELLGDEHRDVAVSMNNLGEILCSQDRHQEAEQVFLEALEISRRSVGRHPTTAKILNNLALELKDLNRSEEAASLMQEALSMARSIFGDRHPLLALTQFNTAVFMVDAGQGEAAIELLKQTLALMDDLGISDHRLAYPLTLLAEQLSLTDRCVEAGPLAQRALELRSHLPADNELRRRTEQVAALCSG